MPVIADIADAVASELNTGEFSQEFEAVRLYLPVYELPEMKILRVTVVPRAVEITTASRSLLQHDYQIDVAVQKKFESDTPPEIDPLMQLVEEIMDFFRTRRLESLYAFCVKIVNEPAWSPEHMEQFRQFTSVITLTFRIMR